MRNAPSFTIRHAKMLLACLISISLLLTLVHLLTLFFPFDFLGKRTQTPLFLFNMDNEGNIPSWFASSLLLIAGMVYLFVSWLRRSAPKPSSFFFLVVGLGLIFLSLDESAGIHEKVGGILNLLPHTPSFRGERGHWMFPYLILGLILCLMFFRDVFALLRALPRTSRLIFAGVMIFLIGAVGLEIISYEYLRRIASKKIYMMEVALEEFFELLGVSIIIYAGLLLALGDYQNMISKSPKNS